MMEKKIDTAMETMYVPSWFTCGECGNSDNDKLMIIPEAPWVVECIECGHPNDARWDHDMIDVFRSCAT
jgi:hypothetical protein